MKRFLSLLWIYWKKRFLKMCTLYPESNWMFTEIIIRKIRKTFNLASDLINTMNISCWKLINSDRILALSSFEFIGYDIYITVIRNKLTDSHIYRHFLPLYQPAQSLRNSRITDLRREQAISATSQLEMRSYQRHHNVKRDVIKLGEEGGNDQ